MPAPIGAIDIDEFLVSQGSPMAGIGAELVNVGWRYDLDPRLLVAIAGADTGFGRVLCTDFNAWNWFWHSWCDSPFDSWAQAADEVARGLRIAYLDEGLTDIYDIAVRYGPLNDPRDILGLNRFWPANVTRVLERLGGSRCNLTWVQSDLECRPPPPMPTPRPEERALPGETPEPPPGAPAAEVALGIDDLADPRTATPGLLPDVVSLLPPRQPLPRPTAAPPPTPIEIVTITVAAAPANVQAPESPRVPSPWYHWLVAAAPLAAIVAGLVGSVRRRQARRSPGASRTP